MIDYRKNPTFFVKKSLYFYDIRKPKKYDIRKKTTPKNTISVIQLRYS